LIFNAQVYRALARLLATPSAITPPSTPQRSLIPATVPSSMRRAA
jgi:hypothetical protein